MSSIKFIKNISTSATDRTQKAKLNIVVSFFLKGCTILISLFLVPLTLGYLNSYEYGIWLTLSSVLMWINYFDIGLGNGLRNKLSEALSKNDKELGQVYVSTTFFLLFSVMAVIFIVFIIMQIWLDWSRILNVTQGYIDNLNSLVTIVFAFFCVNFVLKFIGNIYLAKQLPMVNDFINLLGSLLSLIIIFILSYTTKGNLSYVAIVYSLCPILIYLIAYPITFNKYYKYLKPQLKSIKLKYAKDLMGLGFQFFIIQIAYLIIFTTSNILISQLFGPQDVTPFNIAFKYFSVISMLFNIMITPMWSAITEAYIKNDIVWIKKSITKMLQIWLLLLLVTVIMIILSNFVYKLWVGDGVKISLMLSLFTGLYVSISNFNNIFAYCINGIGKIRMQLYTSVISGIVFIPIAIIFSKYWGVLGIMIGMCLVLISSAILLPIQYYKIITNTAKGIWIK